MNTVNVRNIIEINEMIDLLDDYFSDVITTTLTAPRFVGGMVGTTLVNDTLNAALAHYNLEQILFIQGCQDFIELLNEKNCKVYNQYVYYADLFTESPVDSVVQFSPFVPKIMQPKPEYVKNINFHLLQHYSVIIINDAHLIPAEYINTITQNFCGKIVCIVDPFDIGGEVYCNVPTVVDTFEKVTPINAFARETFNVESRMINKKAKGTLSQSKMNIRSIGKLDDKQYITNDPEVIEIVRMKQLRNPFRKNHKVLVCSDLLYNSVNTINSISHHNVVTRNSMIVVDAAYTKPLMRLRVYSSKNIFHGDLSYIEEPFTRYSNKILCKPANILSIDESVYHRYQHSVLVTHGDPFTLRERYSVLKNSMNVTIAKI